MGYTKLNDMEKTLKAFRLYHGSMTLSLAIQKQLFAKAMKAAQRLATATRTDLPSLILRVGAEAAQRGPMSPLPGIDYK